MNQLDLSSFSVRVAHRHTVGDDIVVLDLVASDGLPLPPFTAGAHVELQLQAGPRQYSLCNDPRDASCYRIAVHRVANGRGGSAEVYDAVQPGQLIPVRGPFNHFEMVPGATEVLLLAGGIGITPVLAMAHSCHAQSLPFALHYSGRTLARMAFAQELLDSPLAPHVQLHADDGQGAQPLALDATIGAHTPGKHLYVCGPQGMIEAVRASAKAQGWPDASVHFEHFGSNAAAPRADDGSFEVQLASSGRCIRIAPEQTVAQALQAEGIHIPVSCGAGVCGACRTRIVAGTPDHRDLFYSPEEQARGDEFTPCCSRALSPVLVLDL